MRRELSFRMSPKSLGYDYGKWPIQGHFWLTPHFGHKTEGGPSKMAMVRPFTVIGAPSFWAHSKAELTALFLNRVEKIKS